MISRVCHDFNLSTRNKDVKSRDFTSCNQLETSFNSFKDVISRDLFVGHWLNFFLRMVGEVVGGVFTTKFNDISETA